MSKRKTRARDCERGPLDGVSRIGKRAMRLPGGAAVTGRPVCEANARYEAGQGRPHLQSLERLEAELRGEWPKRVCCGECIYRGRTAGECENPESVKAGDYVLPGMSCPKGRKG